MPRTATPAHALPAFRKDGSVNVIVETPRGASIKLKHDPETDAMMLSRPLPLGVTYPYDWGFIPSTRAADADPLDAMLLWDSVGYPGLLVPSRLIGVLKVEQTDPASGRRQRNDRVFALPIKAPRHAHLQSIFDLPERVRLELEQFFLNVVAFEGKELKLLGFAGPADAAATLRAAIG
jgi:inorganic pyrophosphatase